MTKKIILAVSLLIFIWPVMIAAQEDQAPTMTVETQLCTGIEEREPVGAADQFPSDVGQVYLWCKVMGCMDTTMIKHVWYYRGEEMAAVQFPVRSSSWRTYSYKTIPPEWSGDWVVKVIDAGGNIMKAVPFKLGEIEKEPAAEETAPVKPKEPEDTTGAGR